jgi:glycosyltransferase involved in cell wall biosynthesis
MNAEADATTRGELESPVPLRARDGQLTLTGWCAARELRLRVGDHVFSCTQRTPRPDVASAFPEAGPESGYVLTTEIPAGVVWATLECRDANGVWMPWKQLTVASDGPPFTAMIEHPLRSGTLSESKRLSGWAAHPRESVHSIVLRYGAQELVCNGGLPRTDVPALFPGTSHLGECGFESSLNLPAGRGPLRVCAELESGTRVVATTPISVDIAHDENGGTAPAAGAVQHRLPRGESREPGPIGLTDRPLNVLFVLHGSFASNSALHVAALANELSRRGHDCAVAVPGEPETLSRHDKPLFRGLSFAEALESCRFADGRGPDFIHAWTTREHIRHFAEAMLGRHRAHLVVHLEDNEPEVLAQTLGRPFAELAALPAVELDRLVPPNLSHPHRARDFLHRADGITLISSALREHAPAAARCATLWPAADERFFFPRPSVPEFRRVLDEVEGTTVLFYHGNVHAANASEVRELYAAIARLNDAGTPTTLIRTGVDAVDFLGAHAGRVRAHVLEVGQITHHRHLPALMALADVFVQPGVPDAFNDYRFPSKLPEFFAIGRPVVLPRTNLGLHVRHGVDAYVLDRADAEGIARAVTHLRQDPALAARLARGAIEFAEQHFSWPRSAETLAKFYAGLATSG